MSMFMSIGKYIFLGTEDRVSKAGNPFKLVKVADTEAYQQFEFFANDSLEITAQPNKPCSVYLVPNKIGFSTSFSCQAVKSV